MKKMITLLLLVVATLANAQSKEEKALLQLHMQKFNWLVNKQHDSLSQILDDRLVYIHSSGMTENKTEMLNNMKSGKLSYAKTDVKEAQARVYGDAGIVTGKGTFTGVNDGKPFDIQLYYTEVYVKVKKNWKLASRHASRLNP